MGYAANADPKPFMPKIGGDNSLNRWLGYQTKLDEIISLELLVLKIHLITEDALRHLLAMRLDVEEGELTEVRIGFETLVKLALARSPSDPLCQALLVLNQARNKAAHTIGTSDFDDHADRFAVLVEQIKKANGAPVKPSNDRIVRVRRAGDAAIDEVFLRAEPLP